MDQDRPVTSMARIPNGGLEEKQSFAFHMEGKTTD